MKINKTIQGQMIQLGLRTNVAIGISKPKSSFAGIFGATNNTIAHESIHKCLEWKKVPFKNRFKCAKFDPPKDIEEEIKNRDEILGINRFLEEINLILSFSGGN